MPEISSCRAAHLIPFVELFRDIGVPVERELVGAKLPSLIEEIPDEVISNGLATRFVSSCARREGIESSGWLWSQRFSVSNLSAGLLAALQSQPTVRNRLERFAFLSSLESSVIQLFIVKSGETAEVVSSIPRTDPLFGQRFAEWTQIAPLIEIIRSVAGPAWCPDAINFSSGQKIVEGAVQAFPNTRFVRNAPRTSIVMSASVLAMSSATRLPADLPQTAGRAPDVDLDLYRRLLRPYLREERPTIDLFAEMSGTSRRTLQRNLSRVGTSFSELVETTRFEMATELLDESSLSLIDVAMMLGFSDASNFSRSFRRYAGVSPGQYRRQFRDRREIRA